MDKLSHIPFRHLFPRLAGTKEAVLPEGKLETPLQPSTGIQKIITLEVKPLASNDDEGRPFFLIIAKDMTAEIWLEQQLIGGTALYSGIFDRHYVIRMLQVNHSPNKIPIEESLLHQSIFDYLDPANHAQIKEKLLSCRNDKFPRDVIVHTIRFDEMSELTLRVTICPIFDGFGQIQHYAFSIWDLRGADEAEQPGMKLKIWMAKRDLSASQLSVSTGISLQTISKLRNGKIAKPQRLTAELIASELRVDIHELWPELARR